MASCGHEAEGWNIYVGVDAGGLERLARDEWRPRRARFLSPDDDAGDATGPRSRQGETPLLRTNPKSLLDPSPTILTNFLRVGVGFWAEV
jgi:hypothetical protein